MSEIQRVTEEPRPFVGIRRKVPVTELASYFHEVLPRVHAWLQSSGIEQASPPIAVWHSMDMESGIADAQAGCFVKDEVEGNGEITCDHTSGGELLRIVHRGPYTSVGQSWQKLYARAAELGLKPGPGWEIYVDDPDEVEAAELRTEISLPVS